MPGQVSSDRTCGSFGAVDPHLRHTGTVTTYRIAEAADLIGVSDDTLRRWIDQGRLPTARHDGRAVVEGADLAALAEALADSPDREGLRSSSVSARNRLAGIVVAVKKDTVMAQVEMICGPHRIVSLMSADAADELGLARGERAIASIKSTNVVLERP
jgi:molybdopterin-binding protein